MISFRRFKVSCLTSLLSSSLTVSAFEFFPTIVLLLPFKTPLLLLNHRSEIRSKSCSYTAIDYKEAMKCFHFCSGEKKEEPKTRNRNTARSSVASRESRVESSGNNQHTNLSERTSDHLKVFTLLELKQITKNFSNSAKLGEGGFGCVFKGVIKNSEDPATKITVAVKQLGKQGRQGQKEWITEVNLLGVVDHPNLVKLIGYCAEDDERGIQRLLVYEYMPNGSVDDHLSRATETLPWATRLRVALDTARGLAYLHEEMDFQIIFRDFKSSNILLDEQWNAKLSDFGFARLGPPEGRTHVSTAVVGTMGYAAPEYLRTGHLTSKSDVWSYGVFLYELITGRRPLERNRPKNEQKLLEWLKPYISDAKKFEQILDPRLEPKQILRSALKLSIIANRCLARASKTRPKMSEVAVMLHEVVEAVGDIPPPLKVMEPKRAVKVGAARARARPVHVRTGGVARTPGARNSEFVGRF